MTALRGLAWLLVLQSLGEVLARGLALPFPGPVVGMVLLLLALRWRVVREPVALCADFLLSHLSLLFVPVGVGVEKLNSMCVQFSAMENEQMFGVKRAFDPKGLLNPGKVIPTLHRCAEYGRMHVKKGLLPFPELERF